MKIELTPRIHEGKFQKKLHFKDVEITPEKDFNFTVEVKKQPIEIKSGDELGANLVRVEFTGETQQLIQDALPLRSLPEEERIVALVELIRSKLKFPYKETVEEAILNRPELEIWLKQSLGDTVITSLDLNSFLKNGYGDCKIMAAAYLIAAQAAGLKGIFANSAKNPKNVLRPDNGMPIFRNGEVGKDVGSGHAWVEINLPDGRWIPVDPTVNLIGLGDMIQVFRDAEYRTAIGFKDKMSEQLQLKRGAEYFEPGEANKKIALAVQIKRRIVFGEKTPSQTPVAERFSGNTDVLLTSSEDPKSLNLEFSEAK